MIERATDMNSVSRILNHPKVSKWMLDDCTVLPYTPDPAHMFIINEGKTGLVRIEPLNGVTCMVHIATLPEMRGQTVAFVKECLDWLFENTLFSKVIGMTPECNRAAIVFGKRCGFKVEGKVTKSFLKNWKLHDQVIFGLSKYD